MILEKLMDMRNDATERLKAAKDMKQLMATELTVLEFMTLFPEISIGRLLSICLPVEMSAVPVLSETVEAAPLPVEAPKETPAQIKKELAAAKRKAAAKKKADAKKAAAAKKKGNGSPAKELVDKVIEENALPAASSDAGAGDWGDLFDESSVEVDESDQIDMSGGAIDLDAGDDKDLDDWDDWPETEE